MISYRLAEALLPHYGKRHFALIGGLPPVCPTVRGILSVRMDLMRYEGRGGGRGRVARTIGQIDMNTNEFFTPLSEGGRRAGSDFSGLL